MSTALPARDVPLAADMVIVGAGITGLACAVSAARRGSRVVVIEKEDGPAREASGRAQALLRVQGRGPEEMPLAKEALERWRALEEGEEIERVFGGSLYLCDEEQEVEDLRAMVRDAASVGLDTALLTPDEVRKIIPAATGPFLAAAWSPTDGHCQPLKATIVFGRHAVAAGADICYNTKALRLVERGGTVTGVLTSKGLISCGAVVVAAGVWTGHLLQTIGVKVPIMPLIFSEGETTVLPPLFRSCVRAYTFGARQRPDGRVRVCAGINTTVQHLLSFYDFRDFAIWFPRLIAYRRSVLLRADVRTMLAQARRLSTISPALIPVASREAPANTRLISNSLNAMKRVFPVMEEAQIGRTWTGVVDMSPDGLPIIDASAGPIGVVIVTGLSGHGFALGPVIGEIAADLAITGHSSRPIGSFRLSRFREGRVPVPAKMI